MQEPTERRVERRRRVQLRAKVSGVEDELTIDCLIQEASRSGCSIVSHNVHLLPTNVRLVISGFDEPITGELIWREADTAGVKFLRDEAEDAAPELAS